jgi:hypothetical protein
MTHLSISQAAKIAGFNRSYFYKIIEQYRITIKHDSRNKPYIDVSELVRALPQDQINLKELQAITGELVTAQNNTPEQKTTLDNTQLTTLLTEQVNYLKEQLAITQQQNQLLLETVNRQTLLLDYKQQDKTTDNTEKQHQVTNKSKPKNKPKSKTNDLIEKLKSKSKKK